MENQIDLKIWPDPILKKKAQPVTDFDEDLQNVVAAMKEVMEQAQGVGLAAPQVGISKRIIAYKVSGDEGILINPEITERSEETQELQEGCLSFPGIYIKVDRHRQVTVKFQDENGEKVEKTFEGFAAQMVQHEIDHLNGEVFTKFLSHLKRDLVNRKMKKVRKAVERRWKEYEKAAKQQAAVVARQPRPNLGTPTTEQPTGRDTGVYDFSDESE